MNEWLLLSELVTWLFPYLFKMSEWLVITAFLEISTRKKNKNEMMWNYSLYCSASLFCLSFFSTGFTVDLFSVWEQGVYYWERSWKVFNPRKTDTQTHLFGKWFLDTSVSMSCLNRNWHSPVWKWNKVQEEGTF